MGLHAAADVACGGVSVGESAGHRRCRILQLLFSVRVRCVLGRSAWHGFGDVIVEQAAEDDLIGKHVGQLTSDRVFVADDVEL